MKNISVLIPAAGKGSRTGLNYPKTLFKINNTPILIKILKNFSRFDKNPTIIVNPTGEKIIYKTIKNSVYKAELIIQKKQNGMGDAVLCYKKSKFYKESENILMVWGDVPYIRYSTLKKLYEHHINNKNQFTFITGYSDKAYTFVNRYKNGNIKNIKETHGSKKKLLKGERDIGVFMFNKKVVYNELSLYSKKKINKNSKEHGFLYIIESLVKKNYKVEALAIANKKEMVSFNKITDLEK